MLLLRRAPALLVAGSLLIGALAVVGLGRTVGRAPEPAPLGRFRALSFATPALRPEIPEALPPPEEPEATNLPEQRRRLFVRMQRELHLSDPAMQRVRDIFEHSTFLGQGNPSISQHSMTRKECRDRRAAAAHLAAPDARCLSPNMVVVSGAADAGANGRFVCMDQYEFPDIPCEYPVVHVQAREAVLLCEAIGKRICDAHEWEGACAGAVLDPDSEYFWNKPRMLGDLLHNETRARVWAYGPEKNHALCATGGVKSPRCGGGGYYECGSNTYPAGAFPDCVSPFGVYDQHGNAAEHMNLPLTRNQLASNGGHGYTEMKGSWFFFGTYEAHEDDCRWRAPAWHGSEIMDKESHENYHLGFRCCKNVEPGERIGGLSEE